MIDTPSFREDQPGHGLPGAAAFADVDELNTRNSGYYPGPSARMMWLCVRLCGRSSTSPALRALWTSLPLWSAVSFGRGALRRGTPDTFDARQMAAYLKYRAEHG